MKFDLPKLAFSIILCEAAGIVGSVFTFPAITTWYAALAKPAFTPPSWVFGPAWTLLYLLMGISLYLAWEKGLLKKENRPALIAFGTQLALNTLWSLLFFGLRSPLLGLVCIALLWISILASACLFWKISKPAALLLLPYLAWVTFASALNYAVWTLNP